MPTLISARDVESAAAAGKAELSLGSDAVLTPAARDRARELGLRIANGLAPTPSTSPTQSAPPSPASSAQPAAMSSELTVKVNELRNQRAMLEFVAGLKGYTNFRSSAQTYMDREAAFEQQHGRKPATPQEALQLISDQPAWRTDQFVMNVSQDMLWKSVLRILEPHRQELTSRLTAAENRGPGRLELNPNLQLPDYYTATEFHIMPGSYHTDEIAGWVFEIGGSIYFNNAYDANAMQMAIVESLPAGFVPTKILDVGCSTGTSTTVWKETFPQADVTGIDLAAPMLRYGHLKAMELGLDVTFSQRLAEDTGYPDNSFDLVTACILTHELPTSAVRAFFREAFRILKAGGLLLNGDIPPLRAMPGGSSMGILRHDFEKYNNGEAYIPEILGNGQLPDLMREAGFRAVTEPATPHKRTGQTFPWITYGWK